MEHIAGEFGSHVHTYVVRCRMCTPTLRRRDPEPILSIVGIGLFDEVGILKRPPSAANDSLHICPCLNAIGVAPGFEQRIGDGIPGRHGVHPVGTVLDDVA